ncbi:2-hydroxyacid dehydrogenase [Pokkaliibacter sp. CJK22405]|uniref:2-hydroxyacid dehydrogenase n=1 Tax=Pokkaliibacter sp. CJK22405 TaxID=3384615 RepID=UPI003984E573
MKVLFGAPEEAWGGMMYKLAAELPELEFTAAGSYDVTSLAGFDILIPTMTPVSSELLQTATQLKLIQQIGAGLEGVDLDTAREQQIAVANVPTDKSGNADSVAELGILMMLSLIRNFSAVPEALANGALGQPRGRTLLGSKAVIVGLGGLGEAFAVRLHGFGMQLRGVRRRVDEEQAQRLGLEQVFPVAEIKTAISDADFVILTLPDSAETRGLFNADMLSAMRPGSFLINVGRGGLVERDALFDALASGHLAGAGLDVFWQEPPDANDPIFSLNVVATPHIGGVTDIAQLGIFRAVSDNLRRLQKGQELLYRAV